MVRAISAVARVWECHLKTAPHMQKRRRHYHKQASSQKKEDQRSTGAHGGVEDTKFSTNKQHSLSIVAEEGGPREDRGKRRFRGQGEDKRSTGARRKNKP